MAEITIDKQVKDFLKTLGSGPNKIAENLTEMKIKGSIGDSNDCPVAKAIRKKFKSLKNVSVGENLEFVHKKEDYTLNYPVAICKFIEKFDNAEYPALATKSSLAGVV